MGEYHNKSTHGRTSLSSTLKIKFRVTVYRSYDMYIYMYVKYIPYSIVDTLFLWMHLWILWLIEFLHKGFIASSDNISIEFRYFK